MEAASFLNLPILPNRRHVFVAMHVIINDLPRAVAVETKKGLWQLPCDLWPCAEIAVRAAQDSEIEEMPGCTIHQFIIQVISQAIAKHHILEQLDDKQGGQVLSVLLRKSNLLALEDADKAAKFKLKLLALQDAKKDQNA